MDKYTIKSNETLADVAVSVYLNLEALPALASANGYAITDVIPGGTELVLPALDLQPAAQQVTDERPDPERTYIMMAGQTLADVATAVYLTLEALPELAEMNGLALTAEPAAGTELRLPTTKYPRPNEAVTDVQPSEERTAVVLPGQCITDVAVQECGDASSAVAIANLNGLALTADVAPGTSLKLPPVSDKRVYAYMAQGGYKPAAGEILNTGSGIGYWGIEFDFIVQ